jgi:hypothetical protein
MTIEERREAAVDVLAQAALSLALARARDARGAGKPVQYRSSEELACSPEQRLHVQETAGDGRPRRTARDMEEEQ